jgi:hypothetical protein
MNFIVKVYYNGKVINELKNLTNHYLSNGFKIDILFLIMLFVDMSAKI